MKMTITYSENVIEDFGNLLLLVNIDYINIENRVLLLFTYIYIDGSAMTFN